MRRWKESRLCPLTEQYKVCHKTEYFKHKDIRGLLGPILNYCSTSDFSLLPQVSSNCLKKETESVFVLYCWVACSFQKC